MTEPTVVMDVASNSLMKRNTMDLTINLDIEPSLYARLEKEAKKYREEIEDVIMRAIEDYYG